MTTTPEIPYVAPIPLLATLETGVTDADVGRLPIVPVLPLVGVVGADMLVTIGYGTVISRVTSALSQYTFTYSIRFSWYSILTTNHLYYVSIPTT